MASANVNSVYIHVMEDVINNVRADFQSEGVEDSVLHELQALWELKMMQSGAITGPISEASSIHTRAGTVPPTPVQDLNIPYEATDDYEAPAAEMLFPGVQRQNLSNPSEPVMFQYMAPGPEQSRLAVPHISSDGKLGRPSGFMHQPPAHWMKGRGVDVNVVYEEGQEDGDTAPGQAPITKDFFTLSTGKRKRDDLPINNFKGYIPQQDGVGDVGLGLVSSASAQQEGMGKAGNSLLQSSANMSSPAKHSASSLAIPQFDGADDNYGDDVAEEDYNEPGEEDARVTNDVAQKSLKEEGTESEGSEPPLNEEDDDEDDMDDIGHGDDEPKTNHLVLAQFEKVTRTKNKWKCILKDGIMHLNNRDILFLKANGEFEF